MLVSSFLVGLVCVSGPAPGQDLVAGARRDNRCALAAIHTIRGNVRFTIESHFGTTVYEADCLKSAEGSRVSQKLQGTNVRTLVLYRAGIQRALIGAEDGRGDSHGIVAPEAERITDFDLWSLALCFVPPERLTLDELLSRPHRLRTAESGSSDGKAWVRVDFQAANGARFKVRLDGTVNHLIDRVEYFSTRQDGERNTDVRSDYEVTHFVEAAPGVYFPALVVSKHYENGRLVVTHTVEIFDVVVNEDIPLDAFSLRFPSGTYVTDKIRGVSYRVGADEEPVGEVHKYSPAISESVARAPEPERSRWSASWLIMIGSITIVAAGLFLLVRSRRATK